MLTNWTKRIPGLVKHLSRRDRRRLKVTQTRRSILRVEPLEDRTVPATAKLNPITQILTITGTAQDETLWVERVAGAAGAGDRFQVVEVTATGANTLWSGEASKVDFLVANLGNGNDDFQLIDIRLQMFVNGNGGHDEISVNGAGRAVIDGGPGNDLIIGGSENDVFTITAGEGSDNLTGGGGLDRVEASGNVNFVLTNNSLAVGAETSTLFQIGQAALTGGAGANKLDALQFSGDVTLHGGGGDDTLYGGAGKSELHGEGSRYDLLVAGSGPTEFYGGSHSGTRFEGRPAPSAAELAGRTPYKPSDARYLKPELPADPTARRAALDKFWTDFLAKYNELLPDPSATSQHYLKLLVERLLQDDRIQDLRWITYFVATAKHETGDYVPRSEALPNNWHTYTEAQKKAFYAEKPYFDPNGPDGDNYYGRGWAQITWKSSYQDMSQRLYGDDRLVTNPSLANDPEIAYEVLSYGILSGYFNDVNWVKADGTRGNPKPWGGLDRYLNDGTGAGGAVFGDARRIVNFWEVESTKAAAEAREKQFIEDAVKIQQAIERGAAEIRGTTPGNILFLNFLYDLERESQEALTTPVQSAIAKTGATDLPLIRENLNDLTQVSDRFWTPFDGLLAVDAAEISAPDGPGMAGGDDFSALGGGDEIPPVDVMRQRLIDALTGAGMVVEFLTQTGSDTDAQGNLLRVRYNPSPVPARSVGTALDSAGGTGFSYLDDRVNGTLSGSISASIGAATSDLVLGIDKVGGTHRLYVAAGGLVAGGAISVTGSVTGGLSIRSLADVTLTGRLTGTLTAGLHINDVDGTADGRLDADRLIDGVRLGIDGELKLEGASPGSPAILSAKLPVVGTIDWTATFTATIHSDFSKPPADWVSFHAEIGDPADPLGVLVQAAKGLFQVFGGSSLPLPGGLGSLLGQDDVKVGSLSIPFNLAEHLGLPSSFGTLLRGAQLVGDLTSLQRIRDALHNIHENLEFLPGRDLSGPMATIDVVRDLIRGNKVDLVRFHIEERDEWAPDPLTLFQVTVPVPPVFTATLRANLEAYAGYTAYLGLGVDTTGFYIDPNTRLAVRGGVRFGLEGAVEIAGLLGVAVELGAGLALEAGVKVNDPDPTDGKVYFDEIYNSVSTSGSFLQTFRFYAGADATGFARVKLTLPWPLPDINLVDEEFRLGKLWDTNDNKSVRDVNPRGTYRVRPLASDAPLDLESMVDPVTRVLTLQAGDIDPASIRVSGTDGTVNVTWFGRGQGTVSNISKVRFIGHPVLGDRFEADPSFDRPIDADGRGGVDVLVGGAAADTLRGGDGGDELAGAGGNDRLEGGTGDDTAVGGAGDDTALGNAGLDRLEGGSGRDLLDGGEDEDYLVGGSGNDTLQGAAAQDDLRGGDGDDHLDGGTGSDRLFGEAGADNLVGGPDASADLLDGGAGRDNLDGGAGKDILLGGDGDDLLDGGPDKDYLVGDAGDDVLLGGVGNDNLRGGDGADQLVGNGGDDILNGGGGTDVLFGDDRTLTSLDGSARDRFEIELGPGEAGVGDTIDGGPDRDYVVLIGPALTEVAPGTDLVNENGDPIKFKDVRDDIRVRYEPASREFVAGWREVGSADDYIETRFTLPEAVDAVIVEGRGGDDLLQVTGTSVYPFQLNGGAGKDFIQGGPGPDTLVGGDESDTIRGGPGDDLIYGGSGFDQLNAGDLGDDIDGEAGNDAIQGERGNDTLTGGDGRDVVNGDAGQDTLYAGPGLLGDVMRGGPDDDVIYGGDGADVLIGGPGADLLEGGGSLDVLDGGTEGDILKGGAGRDMFFGGPGADTIYADGRAPGAQEVVTPEYFAQLVQWHREYIETDPFRSTQQKLADLARLDTAVARRSGQAQPAWTPDDEILLLGELNYTMLDRQRAVIRSKASSIALELLSRDYPTLWTGSNANETALVQAQNELASIMLTQIDVGLPLQQVLTDNLNGGSGNDTLWGSQFNDLMAGDDDHDRLYWSRGQDFLFGGAGTDEFIVFGTDEADEWNFVFDQETGTIGGELKTINKVIVNDEPSTVMYKNDPAVLTKLGNPDIESFGIELRGGDDTASFAGLARWVPVEGELIVDGGPGNDTIDARTYEGRTRLQGGPDDDAITGGVFLDRIDGGDGNDNLSGGLSADTISGGDGDDAVIGGGGNDRLFGETEADPYPADEYWRDLLFGDDQFATDPNRLYSADVNGDGLSDLISMWYEPAAYEGIAWVKLSNGDGSYSDRVTRFPDYTYSGDLPNLLGDLDGDGRADFVRPYDTFIYLPDPNDPFGYIEYPAVGLTVLRGSPDGRLLPAPEVTVQVESDGWTGQPALIGDVNGDGRDDVILRRLDPTAGVQFLVLAQDQSGAWQAVATNPSTTWAETWVNSTYPSRVGDVNGDGRADLIAFSYDTTLGTSSRTALGQADGTFTFTEPVLHGDGNGIFQTPPKVADVNGDGRDDVVFAFDNGGSVEVRVALGLEDGRLDQLRREVLDAPASYLTLGWNVGRVDDDEFDDLIFVAYVSGTGIVARAYSSYGDGTWEETVHTFGDGTLPSPLAGQFDDDGRTDLAFAGRGFVPNSGANVRTRLTSIPNANSAWGYKEAVTIDGNDVLDGGAGYDLLWNGGGADTDVIRLTDSDNLPGFARGTDLLSVPGASVTSWAVTEGYVYILLTNRELWSGGWLHSSNVRSLQQGSDGRTWYLTRDGYLYGGTGSYLAYQNWGVVNFSLDSGGGLHITRAAPGSSWQDYRYNSSSDTFWAAAGGRVYKNGSEFAVTYRIRFDWLKLDHDFDGFLAGDGEWYVDVSGWRPIAHHGLGEATHNFYITGPAWSSSGSFSHYVQVWEDDEYSNSLISFTISDSVVSLLFWDGDHSGYWWGRMYWSDGTENKVWFTYWVEVPSGW